MIESSRAIVLHQIKYSETSVIATMYTEKFGRQSYIINGIRSSKSKQKAGMLQPLFLLEIEVYHKPGREVQRMKEFRILEPYHFIPFDIIKSSMAMFLAEILYKVIRNVETENSMFEFIFNSLIYFDTLEKGTANFHLWFLMSLSGYLGFLPNNNYNEITRWFDHKNGSFTTFRPSHPNTPDEKESKLFSTLLSLKLDDLEQLKVEGLTRSRMLAMLVDYYTHHFDSIGKINSLEVLNVVFH